VPIIRRAESNGARGKVNRSIGLSIQVRSTDQDGRPLETGDRAVPMRLAFSACLLIMDSAHLDDGTTLGGCRPRMGGSTGMGKSGISTLHGLEPYMREPE
jgi:hypothetical protein